MRVIVTDENKGEVVKYLSSLIYNIVAFDTETYGLKWHHEMFALQLTVQGGDSFYFNFHQYGDGTEILDKDILKALYVLWKNPYIRWVAHNAKFDMRRLDIEGITLSGDIWDTMVMAHIEYNKHFSYSLDNCLKRLGHEKNEEVMKYIKDNKCYTTYNVEGKKTKEKDLHFDRVPFSIMNKYGFDDVELTLKLYEHQFKLFYESVDTDQKDIVGNNILLVKSVFNMEREGIKVNLSYCESGKEQTIEKIKDSILTLSELSGRKFINGPKWLKEVLLEQNIELEVSQKGNVILNKSKLKTIPNAIAHHVLEMRNMEKESSFYATFARFTDKDGLVHPNYRLTGTDTGRFSCSDPNLQQVPKEAKALVSQEFTIRGSFEAGEDFIFVSIDYDQMEYRIMADYAGEMGMIEAIKGGLDPHDYVAKMMDVERTPAKTLNFGLLYGMGIGKLALALKVSEVKARQLKSHYYSELPSVLRLVRQIQDTAIGRGYIKNKYGRRYYLDDPKWAYKMPNYLIQGTGADVVRFVIPKIDYFLEEMKSKVLLQIHDEFIFKIHKDEVHIVPELKRIMEDEYKPMNDMNLTCGVEWSPKTWDTRSFKPWSTYGH